MDAPQEAIEQIFAVDVIGEVTIVGDVTAESTSGQYRVASYPFNKPEADIILQSCDNVEFRVRGAILSEASPYFEGKVSFRNRYGGSGSTIKLDADSKSLETLLCICYPIVKPALDLSLVELESALKAAIKYQMELPISVLAAELVSRAPNTPLEVWAIGCRTRQEQVARSAAEVLCVGGILKLDSVDLLKGVVAGDYYRLREFVRLRGKVDEGFLLLTPPPRLEEPPTAAQSFPELKYCDLICRSSDAREFNVHKGVLCAASAVLGATIAARLLPSGAGSPHAATNYEGYVSVTVSGGRSGLQEANKRKKGKKGSNKGNTESIMAEHPYAGEILSIDANASGDILAILLRLCYFPRDTSILPDTPSKLVDLMAVAAALEMAEVIDVLNAHWATIARRDPLSAYLVAVRFDTLFDRAAELARYMLEKPIDGAHSSEMECTPALPYHRLMCYYESCRSIATQQLSAILETRCTGESSVAAAKVPGATPPKPASMSGQSVELRRDKWFARYVENLCDAAKMHPSRVRPTAESVYEDVTVARQWCSSCQAFARTVSQLSGTLQGMPDKLLQVAF